MRSTLRQRSQRRRQREPRRRLAAAIPRDPKDGSLDPREDIRAVLAAYCQTVDQGLWADFEELWCDDAVVTVFSEKIAGRTQIRAWMEAAQPPEARGRHLTVNSLIAVNGSIASVSSDFAWLALGDGKVEVSTVGRYLDTMRLESDQKWRFSERAIELDPRIKLR